MADELLLRRLELRSAERERDALVATRKARASRLGAPGDDDVAEQLLSPPHPSSAAELPALFDAALAAWSAATADGAEPEPGADPLAALAALAARLGAWSSQCRAACAAEELPWLRRAMLSACASVAYDGADADDVSAVSERCEHVQYLAETFPADAFAALGGGGDARQVYGGALLERLRRACDEEDALPNGIYDADFAPAWRGLLRLDQLALGGAHGDGEGGGGARLLAEGSLCPRLMAEFVQSFAQRLDDCVGAEAWAPVDEGSVWHSASVTDMFSLFAQSLDIFFKLEVAAPPLMLAVFGCVARHTEAYARLLLESCGPEELLMPSMRAAVYDAVGMSDNDKEPPALEEICVRLNNIFVARSQYARLSLDVKQRWDELLRGCGDEPSDADTMAVGQLVDGVNATLGEFTGGLFEFLVKDVVWYCLRTPLHSRLWLPNARSGNGVRPALAELEEIVEVVHESLEPELHKLFEKRLRKQLVQAVETLISEPGSGRQLEAEDEATIAAQLAELSAFFSLAEMREAQIPEGGIGFDELCARCQDADASATIFCFDCASGHQRYCKPCAQATHLDAVKSHNAVKMGVSSDVSRLRSRLPDVLRAEREGRLLKGVGLDAEGRSKLDAKLDAKLEKLDAFTDEKLDALDEKLDVIGQAAKAKLSSSSKRLASSASWRKAATGMRSVAALTKEL